MQFATVVGEKSGDLFADERARQVRNLETTSDRVVIGDGDVIHPTLDQLPVQFLRVRIAVREIKTPKKPFFRARTVARMNM